MDDTTDKGYARLTARSRQLRRDATPAERHLWQFLKARQLGGVRFNRQFPIGPFIGDFVSREHRLVIEFDGGHHATSVEYDRRRTQFLNEQGYTVIRFWNADVLDTIERVIARIGQALADMPSPDPSRKREGSLWSPTRSRGRDASC